MKKSTAAVVTGGAGLLTALGFGWVTPEFINSHMPELFKGQIAQAGFFFTLAALLHAKQVKKEIAVQFELVTSAINNVSISLRADLADQSNRLTKVERGVNTLNSRVDTLEKP